MMEQLDHNPGDGDQSLGGPGTALTNATTLAASRAPVQE